MALDFQPLTPARIPDLATLFDPGRRPEVVLVHSPCWHHERGLLRQSKRADLDVALSYDAQLAAIHRLAERDGIDPASVTIFADMGRSGAAGKEKLRPAYLEALALMESDGVEAIYTLSLTRLARSAGELERVADICETRGIRLVTDKEESTTRTTQCSPPCSA